MFQNMVKLQCNTGCYWVVIPCIFWLFLRSMCDLPVSIINRYRIIIENDCEVIIFKNIYILFIFKLVLHSGLFLKAKIRYPLKEICGILSISYVILWMIPVNDGRTNDFKMAQIWTIFDCRWDKITSAKFRFFEIIGNRQGFQISWFTNNITSIFCIIIFELW